MGVLGVGVLGVGVGAVCVLGKWNVTVVWYVPGKWYATVVWCVPVARDRAVVCDGGMLCASGMVWYAPVHVVS